MKNKKASVLRSVSKKYDLNTGLAYFEPKLNKRPTKQNSPAA